MQIADALLLSEEILRQHLKEFQASRKRKPENGGSKEKLSSQQSKQLLDHLQKHTYLYAKDIAVFVKSMWGISYSISGMTDWLHRNQFSYKKPSLVPGKANLEAQEAWIFSYTHTTSKVGFSAAPKQRNSSIENDLILLILGRLRSANFDSFRVAQNQLLRWCGYMSNE